MIAIVDYGMGNLGSIHNMLNKIGVPSMITSDAKIIEAADKLILPGVGAFDNAMVNLGNLGIIPLLNELVLQKKRLILGICLGMQLLSRRSEEGQLPGLGWIDAETIRFRFDAQNASLKIPHMGWNRIEIKRANVLFENMYDEPRFYFVHSYYVRCDNELNVLAITTYGITFHSVIMKENILGTQFHPEKSHKYGLKLLKNFSAA